MHCYKKNSQGQMGMSQDIEIHYRRVSLYCLYFLISRILSLKSSRLHFLAEQ